MLFVLVVIATMVNRLVIDGKQQDSNKSTLLSVCKRLSLYTSVPEVFSTSTRQSKIDLKHLDGMRVILACFIVLFHTYAHTTFIYYHQMRRAINVKYIDDDMWTMTIFNINYTMEAFFAIRYTTVIAL